MDNNGSLVQAMNNISLEDEEEGGIEITEEALVPNDLQNHGFVANLCIVGRFISEGRVDFEALQHTLAVLWKPGRGVYIKELDSNLYLFQFYHEIDVKRVMEGCPWSFNRRALVMSRLKIGQNPRCVSLNTIDLWVQVHDLRVGFMSETILKGVGNYIVQFVQSCPSTFTGVWREYIRIRVTIDLLKPLKRRMKLKLAGHEWYWINFKYENVPSFCFICGIIGHTERFCSQLFEKMENEISKPYGAWMRAPLKKQVKPIGAKWLRNGEVGNNSGTTSQSQDKQSREDDGNPDPNFTPTNTEAVENGANQGVGISQNKSLSAKFGNATFQTNSPIIAGTANREDIGKEIGVIESKKRRTGDGLDSEKVGLNREVLMDSDDVNETDMNHDNT